MRFPGVFLILLCLGSPVVLAQGSNNPEGQQDTGDPGAATSEDNRGTQAAPLVIQIHPTEEDRTIAQENKADREQSAKTEQQIADFTHQLAIGTWVLGGATVLLFGVTAGLLVLARRQAADTKESLILSRQNIDLSRAAERGYAFMGPAANTTNLDDTTISIHCSVGNFGKTPVIIDEVGVCFSNTEPTGDVAQYDGATVYKWDMVIMSGDVDFNLPKKFTGPRSATIFAYGYVKYRDVFKDTHISRFSVKTVLGEGRWDPAGSPAWGDWD